MNQLSKKIVSLGLFLTILFLSSCFHAEDPGPLQEDERHYTLTDFDRLEMGSAFHITVTQSQFFSIDVDGDRRNLNDLEVYKNGSTLVIRYNNSRSRDHRTNIHISMPLLKSAHFSGASSSTISGFYEQDSFDLILSGASVSQIDVDADEVSLIVSGASNLILQGEGHELLADVSGASKVNSYGFMVIDADVKASGASEAKIYANSDLNATASGSSKIYYRGEPSVTSNISGASSIIQDY